MAAGPHPRRVLTMMPRLGSELVPRLGMAAGAADHCALRILVAVFDRLPVTAIAQGDKIVRMQTLNVRRHPLRPHRRQQHAGADARRRRRARRHQAAWLGHGDPRQHRVRHGPAGDDDHQHARARRSRRRQRRVPRRDDDHRPREREGADGEDGHLPRPEREVPAEQGRHRPDVAARRQRPHRDLLLRPRPHRRRPGRRVPGEAAGAFRRSVPRRRQRRSSTPTPAAAAWRFRRR